MRRAWRSLRGDRTAFAALALLALYAAAALAAPWIAPHDPYALGEHATSPPSAEHWFGTDQLGRDLFSRVLHGARLSLGVAAVSVAIALAAGTLVGAVAGYAGGAVDGVLSRAMEMLFALPEIVLAIVVTAILQPGLSSITIAIGIVYTPIFARVTRGAVLAAKREPFVEAARAAGASGSRVLFRHVLPNTADALIVQTSLSFAFALLAEAALSFLGLSGEADAPSWGLMLREGKDWMEQAWWIAFFPGMAIALAVFAFHVLGDGLRDALDPRGGRSL